MTREALCVGAAGITIGLLGDTDGGRAVVTNDAVIVGCAVGGTAVARALVWCTRRGARVDTGPETVTVVGLVECGARAGLPITLGTVVPEAADTATVTVTILATGGLFHTVTKGVLPVGHVDARARAIADVAGGALVVRVAVGRMLGTNTLGTGLVAGLTGARAECVAAVSIHAEATGTLLGSGAGGAIRQRGFTLTVDTEGTGAAVRVAGTFRPAGVA